MALADANSNFIAIEVGAYGKNSDGGIFAQSKLGQDIGNGTYPMLPDCDLPGTSVSAPCVLVGDEAFPLKRNLLRPYASSRADGNPEMTNFNTALSVARRVVENTFGILAQKFRIYNRRIHAKPENADQIVTATCVLHNYIRAYEASNEAPVRTRRGDDLDMESGANWRSLSHYGANATSEAFGVRDKFKDFLFASRNAN
ncbi:uncharacterized protein LOC143363104 [Halictus rubicundus]|uniref:uncharacterized protein LOC143363104 n=1 Tax=Halictus rubicundus TaxID=77578 RepID=UPI0040357A09